MNHPPVNSPDDSAARIAESLERLRSLAAYSQAQHALGASLPRELDAAIDDLRRAAHAEADAILARAREEARQVLNTARVELTGLMAQIVELRRQRDEALGRPAPPFPEVAPPPAMLLTPVARSRTRTDDWRTRLSRVDPRGRVRGVFRVPRRAVLGALALLVCSVLTLAWVMARIPGGASSLAGLGAARSAADGAEIPGAAPAHASNGYTVTAEAIRDVWVRPEVDGQRSSGFLMRAGTTRRWAATSHLSLRVGDAGAVLVAVNGTPPRPLGRDGQVVTETFGAAPQSGETSRTAPAAGVRDSGEPRTALAPPVPLPPPNRPAQGGADGTGQGAAAAALGVPGPVEPLPAAAADEPVTVPPAATPLAREGHAAAAVSTRDVLLARGREWFTAHYAGNRAAALPLTAPRFEFLDERRENDRPPQGGGPVVRTLHDVHVHVAGEGAVLSATMVERLAPDGGREYTSRLSEVWILLDGEWRLLGVRIAPAEGPRR